MIQSKHVIYRSYASSKNKSAQINILAQLNGATPEEIQQVIKEVEDEHAARQASYESALASRARLLATESNAEDTPSYDYSACSNSKAAEKSVMLECIQAGLTARECAIRLGVDLTPSFRAKYSRTKSSVASAASSSDLSAELNNIQHAVTELRTSLTQIQSEVSAVRQLLNELTIQNSNK